MAYFDLMNMVETFFVFRKIYLRASYPILFFYFLTNKTSSKNKVREATLGSPTRGKIDAFCDI